MVSEVPKSNAKTQGIAKYSKTSNEIVSNTSSSRETIVAIAFANDFVPGGPR